MTSVSEFTSAAVSDRGLNEGRPQNEDSYLDLPQHGLFAVADGVGGAQAGEVASQMAVEILGEAFIHMGDADPEDTMRIALERANEAIYQMSRDLPQLASMATTIVAVHVSGDIATIAHVGDSRVYRMDPQGRLIRETDDHSVVEEEVRAGRMTPEQALVHPSRNVISRALGADDVVEPDIKCVLIHPATTFLLCSDGITRHIPDAEIESLLNSEFGPEDICARMKEVCFTRGAEDNLTAVIVQFPGERLAMVDPQDDDIEEVTLAGIRDVEPIPFESDDTIEFSRSDSVPDPDVLDLGVEAIDEPIFVAADANIDEDHLIEATEPEPVYETQVPLSSEVTATSALPSTRSEESDAPFAYEQERSSGGSFRKILSAAGLLIAGAILGLTVGYVYMTKNPNVVDVPVLTNQKSDNVSLTAFEQARRQVDEDPAKYAVANAATPQTADDFFWLGRALLLTGKPVEAKRQFEAARSRLSTFDDRSSARTMANEIAMAIAIIDNEQANEAFAKQIATNTQASPAVNANGNSGSSSSVPVR